MNTIFETRILEYRKPLMQFACYLTRNTEDAKDLVQETYLRALERRHQYAEDNSLFGWLYIMLKRLWLDGLVLKQRVTYTPAPEAGAYDHTMDSKMDLEYILTKMDESDGE